MPDQGLSIGVLHGLAVSAGPARNVESKRPSGDAELSLIKHLKTTSTVF